MLKRIKIKNYRCFDDEIVFDLGVPNNYEFNDHLIQSGIVSKGLVIGKNASGKTNLGLAILDITAHLTDKNQRRASGRVYLNQNSSLDFAEFEYLFMFDGVEVKYKYLKKDKDLVFNEELWIDGNLVIQSGVHKRFVNLPGTETLNIPKRDSLSLSLVKYVYSNSIIDISKKTGKAFSDFMNFVNNMLWFSSTEGNRYIGFDNNTGNLHDAILQYDQGNPKQLESFLKEFGINYELVVGESDEGQRFLCKMNNNYVPLDKICSSGTRSLIFLYLWYRQIGKVSFAYIDEYDAFYHTGLSRELLLKLSKLDNVQIILSTHNTDLISNEILRPDCIFNIANNKVTPLANLTSRALREAHNLQKMYKAGTFYE